MMLAPRRLSLIPFLFLALTGLCVTAHAYAATATTTTLQVTPVCLSQGCVTTLTATVTAGPSAVHPGLVYFCDGTTPACENGLPVGQAQLLANGTATIKRVLAPGVHHLHAVFHGTGAYATSNSATQDITIASSPDKATTTAIVVPASQPQLPFGENTFGASVTSLGLPAATGTVNFVDTSYGNSIIATGDLGPGTASKFAYVPNQLDFSQVPASILNQIASKAVGDFNNDGFQDILIVSSTGTGVNVLLGSATGKFTLAPATSLNTISSVNAVVVADFNGDGKLDIALPNYYTKTIQVALGNGDGTFGNFKSTALTNTPEELYIGDFNNDGIPDAVVLVQEANPPNPSQVVYLLQTLLGKGDGTFTVTSATYPISGFIPVIPADYDRDGNLDLAFVGPAIPGSGGYGSFTVLHGNGDGTFKQLSNPTANFGAEYIVGGDFNADGIPDLVTYDGALLTFWQGIGDGTFTQPDDGNYNLTLTVLQPSSLITGDFNGDGVLDVGAVVTNIDMVPSHIYFQPFFGNNSDPTAFNLNSGTASGPLPTAYDTFIAADFNSDGIPDLVDIDPGNSTTAPPTLEVTTTYVGSSITTSTVANSTPFSLMPAGIHNIVASYPGDMAHAASVSPPVAYAGEQTVNDGNGFTSATGLTLNGGASVQSGALQLADGKSFEARSAFASSRLPVYNFITNFNFQIPGGNGDGFAFVLQSNGPNAVGSLGGALGYGQAPGVTGGPSIVNSVAVVFDLHNNQGEGDNSVRVETGGVTSPNGSIDLTPSGIDLHSGDKFMVQITDFDQYEASLTLTLTDLDTNKTFTHTFYVDIFGALGDTIGYAGFTSGTGATASTVDILNWTYLGTACCDITPITTKLPNFPGGFAGAASQLQLNRGASISGNTLQLTSNTPFEATSAYFNTETVAYSWTTDFDFTINGTGGDGFTFLLQEGGLNAVGTSGGALGYGPYLPGEQGYGIPNSLAVKFDVHNNGGEGNDSTGIYMNGAYPSVPSIDLNPSRIHLASGHRLHARLLYLNGAVNLSITDLDDYAVFTEKLTGNAPYYLPAYVGFTAGSGATSNTIQILNWSFSYNDLNP